MVRPGKGRRRTEARRKFENQRRIRIFFFIFFVVIFVVVYFIEVCLNFVIFLVAVSFVQILFPN